MKQLPKSNLVVVSNDSHGDPWSVGEIHKHCYDFLTGRDIGEKYVVGPVIKFAAKP